jgi:hypothetical protein
MPTTVKLAVNPSFKAESQAQKDALAAAKSKGAIECDYVTAMENIRLSGGLYAIVTQEAVATTPGPRRLEDMDSDELKAMMLTAGVVPQKQMKRAEVIKAIRLKLEGIKIVDEDETGAE